MDEFKPRGPPRAQLIFFAAHSGHASKNSAGQMVSPLRTIMLGRFFCDTSNARRWGLPPAVYRRAEPMSDSMNAALFNPYYTITTPAAGHCLGDLNIFPYDFRKYLGISGNDRGRLRIG